MSITPDQAHGVVEAAPPTGDLHASRQPGGALYGIGVSGGTPDQAQQVAEAGAAAYGS